MSELGEILTKIEQGSLSAQEAAPTVAELVRASARPPAEEWLEREERALHDKDGSNTFTEVASAHLVGRITQEQYDVLFAAVTARPVEAPAAGEDGEQA